LDPSAAPGVAYHSPPSFPIMMMMQLCILRAIKNWRVPRLVY